MMREYVERLDSCEQDSFNNLVSALELGDVVGMLQDLGVDEDKLKGAVYGWALNEAGL